MEKPRINIEKYLNQLDSRWQDIPISKQRKYIVYFFAGYLVLTVAVICKVCYDTKRDNRIKIGHIENPVTSTKKHSEKP